MSNDAYIEWLLLRIVTVLVDRPNETNVTSLPTDTGTIFQVSVAPSDVGKVIGKNGRTAGGALRVLLSAFAVSLKTRFGLDIISNG